jgi:anti-sigma factor (TIGR02949 family)
VYSCQQVIDLLNNYLDDQATVQLRQEIEKHLAHCSTCTVLYDSTRQTLKIVTEAKSFELPSDLSRRITERIMEKVRSRASNVDPDESA